MSWIEREALTPDGDLRPGPAQTPWTTASAAYPLAILATGAWHLERYDTAGAVLETLRNYQDTRTGGAYIERPEHRATGRMDLHCTAQVGMTALTTGRTAMADGAYAWMTALLEGQPDLPRRLYLSSDAAGLITQYDHEEVFSHVVDFQAARQSFFSPGIGAAFLARYGMVTKQERAHDIARQLLELSENGTQMQYDYPDTVHVGKFAWGAAAMLEVEPSATHLKNVLRMADWCADSQLGDGRWNPSGFLFPQPTDVDALWKTGEHVVIVNTMLSALAGLDRALPAPP